MKIAVDIPVQFPVVWKIAAGALEYETSIRHSSEPFEVNIVLPHATLSREEDKDPATWDAVIVHKPHPELDLPKVFVNTHYDDGRACVSIDDSEIAKLVVDQFLSIGVINLAFFGRLDMVPVPVRWQAFSDYARSRGVDAVFIDSQDAPWDALRDIPKPCGILAFNDRLALRFIRICDWLGLRIPQDVHLISVDDTPACMQSSPKLSSVSMPFALVGFHAAKLCAQMVNGESVKPVRISPAGLMLRDSVNLNNKGMKTAAEVAHYLRENLSYPIQMADVEGHSRLTRRRLEQLFRSAYGVSPIAYLKEMRVAQAKKMLVESDAPLKKIVDACGFSDSIHLCRMFKKIVGVSPGAYRKSHRSNLG